MDDVLYLLSSTSQQDDNGVWKPTYTKRQVFCKIGAITRAEFFNAGRVSTSKLANGLSPQMMFEIFKGDYNGEDLVTHNDETYSIYRTYTKGDYVELYCTVQDGTHGKKGDD